MSDIILQSYPAVNFQARVSNYVFSRQGPAGILALSDRVSLHWQGLQSTWLNRKAPQGANSFGKLLMRAAFASDGSDLVGLDIRLREQGFGNSDIDANVCSKIGMALLETLANDDSECVFAAVQDVALLGDRELIHFINLISIPLYIERKQFDKAIAAAKQNRAARICPTSEYFLFKSVLAKKEHGFPVSEGEVSVQDLSDRFCREPFVAFSTSTLRQGGRTGFFACSCPAYLPYALSYHEDESVDQLWNGEDVKEIRRSILDGDYTYCSRTMCPYIAMGTLPTRNEITDPFLRDVIDNRRTEVDRKPTEIVLGHDQTCNLACPSCRTEILTAKNEERARLDSLSEKVFLPFIANSSVTLFLASDGDVFASKHYRGLIQNLNAPAYSDVKLRILTNGLLFTPKEWEALGDVQKLVSTIAVSIDGARQATYEDLRRPGKWSTINTNMEFISHLRDTGRIPILSLHFVVQRKNFEEMVEFVELAKKWNVDSVVFLRLLSIGSYTTEEFLDNDVSDPRHPLYPRLLEILRHPSLHEPQVYLASLAPLQKAADAAITEPEVQKGFFGRVRSMFGRSVRDAA